MKGLNKYQKKCQQCKSNQIQNYICLNKVECQDGYGSIICIKCHQNKHNTISNKNNQLEHAVKLDVFINDFDQFFKQTMPNKTQIQRLNECINSNISTIDELIKYLVDMKEYMISINDIYNQYNDIHNIFKVVKSNKNSENIQQNIYQILNTFNYQNNDEQFKIEFIEPKMKFIQIQKQQQQDQFDFNQNVKNNTTINECDLPFVKIIKQCKTIERRIKKLLEIQSLSDSQIIEESSSDTDEGDGLDQEQLSQNIINNNNSPLSEIKYKSAQKTDDFYSEIIPEILEQIEEIEQTSLKEINDRLNQKGCPYKWDSFNKIDMHLSSRNVPHFINCTITDNGFDYLWCRGGYWSATKKPTTNYGFLDIVDFWVKQKSIIHNLKISSSSLS